jgi:hypothetical protein
MKLYLDDDSADPLLALLLRNAGHDVRIPADIGKSGNPDPAHLQQAILEDRVFFRGTMAILNCCMIWCRPHKVTIRAF